MAVKVTKLSLCTVYLMKRIREAAKNLFFRGHSTKRGEGKAGVRGCPLSFFFFFFNFSRTFDHQARGGDKGLSGPSIKKKKIFCGFPEEYGRKQ